MVNPLSNHIGVCARRTNSGMIFARRVLQLSMSTKLCARSKVRMPRSCTGLRSLVQACVQMRGRGRHAGLGISTYDWSVEPTKTPLLAQINFSQRLHSRDKMQGYPSSAGFACIVEQRKPTGGFRHPKANTKAKPQGPRDSTSQHGMKATMDVMSPTCDPLDVSQGGPGVCIAVVLQGSLVE